MYTFVYIYIHIIYIYIYHGDYHQIIQTIRSLKCMKTYGDFPRDPWGSPMEILPVQKMLVLQGISWDKVTGITVQGYLSHNGWEDMRETVRDVRGSPLGPWGAFIEGNRPYFSEWMIQIYPVSENWSWLWWDPKMAPQSHVFGDSQVFRECISSYRQNDVAVLVPCFRLRRTLLKLIWWKLVKYDILPANLMPKLEYIPKLDKLDDFGLPHLVKFQFNVNYYDG